MLMSSCPAQGWVHPCRWADPRAGQPRGVPLDLPRTQPEERLHRLLRHHPLGLQQQQRQGKWRACLAVCVAIG